MANLSALRRTTVQSGRRRARRLRWIGLATWVLACIAGTASAETPAGFLSEVLDNGMRVSVLGDPHHTVVATQVWYHVGSANEEADRRGFAHLFEHLMFGATENHPAEAYAALHHVGGGRENAYTAFDETVYVSEIAPELHARVLELEADRMRNLRLDPERLANEKRIVSEELRLRMENDPFSRVGIATLKAALGDHPYAHVPGGTRDDVEASTLEHARAFYDRFYGPRNAHVVVVGPFDPVEKLAEVRANFGEIETSGSVPADVPPLSDREFPAEVVLREDLPPVETALLAFPLPPAGGEDHWALLVLQQLLTGGEIDRAEEALVKRRRKAVFATTEWLAMRRGGALVFAAASVPYRRKSTAFRLMESFREELGRLEWLSDESLESAKLALVRQELGRSYDPAARADAIGRAAWWLGDASLAFGAEKKIEAVTRDEVAEAFRRYVSPTSAVRVYLLPERVPLWIRLFGWAYPLVNR